MAQKTGLRRTVLLIVAVLAAASVHAQTQDGFVSSGQTVDITGPDGVCKRVTFASPDVDVGVVMVPTADVAQWQSFYNASPLPLGVTLANCSADCTAPWGTVYTNGTSLLLVSPTRYLTDAACMPGTGGTTCNSWRVKVSCTGGTLSCYRSSNNALYPCVTFDTCTNEDCGGGGCFIPETFVTMEDGSKKRIALLQPGDRIRGGGQANTVTHVEKLTRHEPLYGFNGGRAFVTGGHPFKVRNGGWKAIDRSLTPEDGHNVYLTRLKVGDMIYLDDGRALLVQSIDKTDPAMPYHVYNPAMDGDNTYFANGLLVHNKYFP